MTLKEKGLNIDILKDRNFILMLDFMFIQWQSFSFIEIYAIDE